MHVDAGISQGQSEARTRWGTHESGGEFDRKKRPFLTAEARAFIAQQTMGVIVGPGPQQEPRALLLAGGPGFVETPDDHTCLIPVSRRYATSWCMQGMRAVLASGDSPRVGLCFLRHATRQRLCVQGDVEILPARSPETIWLYMQVRQAFFHCPKYIRTRIAGLHEPSEGLPLKRSGQEEDLLSAEIRAFLARRTLCYLCTVDRSGQYALNHRGGAAGFLLTPEPDCLTPGGMLLLPDYAGNGAFEAIGNILETGRAALLVPGYAEQVALCIGGDATVLEPVQLPLFLREKCRGAQRLIALTVRYVEIQRCNLEEALAYERAYTRVLAEAKQAVYSYPL